MPNTFTPLAPGKVKLLPGLFLDRFTLNRSYMLSLTTPHLLQNFYMEAGLWGPRFKTDDMHGGWEAPTCQLRGHFLGHWLSGAAMIAANTGDQEIKGKADYIISELARCQVENGGEWAGSIPSKYLDWVARGKWVWAPHYTLHKTLMGLWDMYSWGGNLQALDVLLKWAHWFHRWSGQFTRDQMDDILDVETGGMLEIWAELYGLTGEKEHLELLRRYDRPRLFDALLAGKDALTNMHANTTVPEIEGAARAWEVTGDERYRKIVEAYWQAAVVQRGYYATGGQSNGEIWSPPNELSTRLGHRTQEHCVVYNLMRLSNMLLRWTGDSAYADYWERNLYNGILAQQHPKTGMIAYFLAMNPGALKYWGSPTEDFWCCHGSLVQAQANYANHIFYTGPTGPVLEQYIPSEAAWEWQGSPVRLRLENDPQLELVHRPNSRKFTLKVDCENVRDFELKLRLPWWLNADAVVTVNGAAQPAARQPGYLSIQREWSHDRVVIDLPQGLYTVPLPDDPATMAVMEGPVVLAGLNAGGSYKNELLQHGDDKTRQGNYAIDGLVMFGDPQHPESFLLPDNEREWRTWRRDYRTRGQPINIRFVPLYEVFDEPYTIYFEMQP